MALLFTLTSPVTIYPADGLSCSFLLNLQRFFLSKFDKKLSKLHILIHSLDLFAIHHFCNYRMNDKIISLIYSVVKQKLLLVTRIRKTLSRIQPQSQEITCQKLRIWRFKIRRKIGVCTLAKQQMIIQLFILEILVNIINHKLSKRFVKTH